MDAGRTVLVVDDDDAIRTLISRVLKRAEYDIFVAANGSEALSQLRTRAITTVVLDLMMPVMSGFEVLEYLRTHDDAGTPAVVVVSAAGERDLESIHSPLVRAVLRKPFDLTELLAAVEKAGQPVTVE